uniref:Uncharacterized protein n=1 Tax=Lactuca sativa TaxID=4236 RepID=A0A9R1WDY5_LACSA|nr:hypothetical protein LSAT_V11C200064440 [Lactuca sativa]
MNELQMHTTEYGDMFGSEYRFQQHNSLNFFGKEAPLQNWMIMPNIGVVIATRYNMVLKDHKLDIGRGIGPFIWKKVWKRLVLQIDSLAWRFS